MILFHNSSYILQFIITFIVVIALCIKTTNMIFTSPWQTQITKENHKKIAICISILTFFLSYILSPFHVFELPYRPFIWLTVIKFILHYQPYFIINLLFIIPIIGIIPAINKLNKHKFSSPFFLILMIILHLVLTVLWFNIIYLLSIKTMGNILAMSTYVFLFFWLTVTTLHFLHESDSQDQSPFRKIWQVFLISTVAIAIINILYTLTYAGSIVLKFAGLKHHINIVSNLIFYILALLFLFTPNYLNNKQTHIISGKVIKIASITIGLITLLIIATFLITTLITQYNHSH